MKIKIAQHEALLLLALVCAHSGAATAADVFSADVFLADRYRDITPVPASSFGPPRPASPELAVGTIEPALDVIEVGSSETGSSEIGSSETGSIDAVGTADSTVDLGPEAGFEVAETSEYESAADTAAPDLPDVSDEVGQAVADTASAPGFFGRLRGSVRGYLLSGTPEYEAEQRAPARAQAAAMPSAQTAPEKVVAVEEVAEPRAIEPRAIEPRVEIAEEAEAIDESEVMDEPEVVSAVAEATPGSGAAGPAGSKRDAGADEEEEEKKPLIYRLTNVFSGKEYEPVLEQLEDYQDIATKELGERAEMFVTAGPDDKGISLMGSQLNLRDFLHLVAIYNDRVAYQKLEWAIAKSGVDSARALYEPELMASYRYTDSNTPNTTEEEFRRSFAAEFIEQNDDYSVGVEGLVPTGARLKLTYNLRSLDNNIQPAPIRGEENKSYIGFSVTQPVLKGAGGRSVVEAPIIVARKEEGIAMQTFRQALLQSISGAASAYLDAYLAEKKTDLRKRSVEIAETVVNDERERQRFGRSAETTVLDAESALAQRRVQFLTARQELLAARNEMHRLIASRAGETSLPMVLETSLDTSASGLDRMSVLEDAFNNRPEYLASILRAEAEDVKVRYAKNNKLPQLDLVASYGLNGLADTAGNSWDDVWDKQHETLFVGLEFKMPILGNRKAKGELSAANLRKHQALLEIKAAEVAIYNSVDTALSNIRSALEQVGELSMVRETNERLLAVEIARFEAGQSNSRDLLELEERMNRVMEMDLESKINLQKASIGLGLSDGTLLRRFQLEK